MPPHSLLFHQRHPPAAHGRNPGRRSVSAGPALLRCAWNQPRRPRSARPPDLPPLHMGAAEGVGFRFFMRARPCCAWERRSDRRPLRAGIPCLAARGGSLVRRDVGVPIGALPCCAWAQRPLRPPFKGAQGVDVVRFGGLSHVRRGFRGFVAKNDVLRSSGRESREEGLAQTFCDLAKRMSINATAPSRSSESPQGWSFSTVCRAKRATYRENLAACSRKVAGRMTQRFF